MNKTQLTLCLMIVGAILAWLITSSTRIASLEKRVIVVEGMFAK